MSRMSRMSKEWEEWVASLEWVVRVWGEKWE